MINMIGATAVEVAVIGLEAEESVAVLASTLMVILAA